MNRKTVFTSKGIPLKFYVFPGLYRDFLIFLVECGGGKISSSINEETLNIACRYSDIPPNVKVDVLAVDYLTQSLNMGIALYPNSRYVLCENYGYCPSVIDVFKNFLILYKRKCLVKTEKLDDERERNPPQTVSRDKYQPGRRNEAAVSTDQTGFRPVSINIEEDMNMSDQTDDAKIARSMKNRPNRVDSLVQINPSPNKVSQYLDTDMKESSGTTKELAQNTMAIDNNASSSKILHDNGTNERNSVGPASPRKRLSFDYGAQPVEMSLSDSEFVEKSKECYKSTNASSSKILHDNGTNERNSVGPASPRKRLSFDYGAQPVEMSLSDSEFVDKSKECYKSTFSTMKSRRYPYSREEQILVLNYIKDHRYYRRVKGTYIWKCLEKTRVVNGRSWQSMAEHFKKKLLPNIETFANVLTQREIFKFKSICQPNRRAAGGEGSETEISSSTQQRNGRPISTRRVDGKYYGALPSGSAVSSTTSSPQFRPRRQCTSAVGSYTE